MEEQDQRWSASARTLTAAQQELAYRFSYVALPEYVTDCEPWEWHDGVCARLFTVREWRVGAITITVSGEQTVDGDVTTWTYVGGEDQLAPQEHQQLVDALLEARHLTVSLD